MNLRSILFLPLFFAVNLFSQSRVESLFRTVEIRTDTATFSSYSHVVTYDNEQCLYFIYDDEDEVAEVTLYPIGTSTVCRCVHLAIR